MDLYVGNLNKQAGERELMKLFGQFGTVVAAQVVTDNFSRRSRGFAFVTMENHISGEKAILSLNTSLFMSQTLVVRESTTKESVQLQNGVGKK